MNISILQIVGIGLLVLVIVGVIYVIIYLRKNSPFFTVKEQQAVVIERLGKFRRVVGPGIHWMTPLIEKRRKFVEENGQETDYIDQRERTADLPSQQVITKDKIELTVDSVAYYEVSDPKEAIYSQKNVIGAIHQKIKTELRNVIGDTTLEELIKGQQEINQKLQNRLEGPARDWGIRLRSVELQAVTPPESYSQVSEAELELEKAKLDRQAAIERAEGQKQASILQAEGSAEEIDRIKEAILKGGSRDNPNDAFLKIKYLEALQKIADGKATKVFMPFPANPTSDNFFQQAFGMAAGLDAYRAPSESSTEEKKQQLQDQTTPIEQAEGTPRRRIIRRVVKKPVPPSDSRQ